MVKELETVKQIQSAWSDERGDIFNMFEGPIHHIAHITCNPGAVRAIIIIKHFTNICIV
jgi:hypothetical protein